MFTRSDLVPTYVLCNNYCRSISTNQSNAKNNRSNLIELELVREKGQFLDPKSILPNFDFSGFPIFGVKLESLQQTKKMCLLYNSQA